MTNPILQVGHWKVEELRWQPRWLQSPCSFHCTRHCRHLQQGVIVVLASFIVLLGPWELTLFIVFQLKQYCVRKPSDLCNINVSGLKFSKVRLASRDVTGVTQTWGGSWLFVHWTSRLPGGWESHHREWEGQTRAHWVKTTFRIQNFVEACFIMWQNSHQRDRRNFYQVSLPRVEMLLPRCWLFLSFFFKVFFLN